VITLPFLFAVFNPIFQLVRSVTPLFLKPALYKISLHISIWNKKSQKIAFSSVGISVLCAQPSGRLNVCLVF
jgi:hypothetical protein